MPHYDLFSMDGSLIHDRHDIAEICYEYIDSKNAIAINHSKTNRGVCLNTMLNELPDANGVYIIYVKDTFNLLVPLYVGQSEGYIRKRVYRFAKHVEGQSRDDEWHSGAEELLRLGLIKPGDEIFVKFMTNREKNPLLRGLRYHKDSLKGLDEHIAYIAKCKGNKRIKKA